MSQVSAVPIVAKSDEQLQQGLDLLLIHTIGRDWDYITLLENMPIAEQAQVMSLFRKQIKRELSA